MPNLNCSITVDIKKATAKDIKRAAKANPPCDRCFCCESKLHLTSHITRDKPKLFVIARRTFAPYLDGKIEYDVIAGLVCRDCSADADLVANVHGAIEDIGLAENLELISMEPIPECEVPNV